MMPVSPTNTTRTPPRKREAERKSGQSDLQKAIRETAKDMVSDAIFEKRPYLKMAFSNPYNLSLFLGTMAAAVATANPILAALALGAEALWLLHGPESKTLRKLLWDPHRGRVYELVAKQEEINHLAAQNPSFTGDLLRSELIKTRRLVDAFLEMAITCARYERYLDTVDLNELERDREQWQRRISSDQVSPQESDIARKNFAVIMKRIEKLRELRNYLRVARGQLDLIENSFQLIADQIVMMQSPAELSGQLNDLLDGVESIRQTALDTEKILSAMEV
jgi:hypothetical protein